MAKRIDDDVLAELRQLTWHAGMAKIERALDHPLYVKLNKVLEAAGGKWNRKLGMHVFDPDSDAEEFLREAIDTGIYIDPKQGWQFFETPEDLAQRMVQIANVQPSQRVLEPSAGHGRIALAALRAGASVRCVELNHKCVQKLVALPYEHVLVVHTDFLNMLPSPELYDAVLMNPPFTKRQDIQHVQHALKFLRPGGTLVSVMSAGTLFREDKMTAGFREDVVELMDGTIEKLPPETFKESGTGVSTVLVTLHKS